MWRSLKKWLLGWLRGGPHFVIGDPNDPYLFRWYVLPRNPLINVYIHKFMRDDDDRAMHDHPWPSVSLVLAGGYVEHTDAGKRHYRPGSLIVRRATHTHRIELLRDGERPKPAWTLFVTGPRVREWGFHCPQGWMPWKKFVKPGGHGQKGPGCDQ